MANKILYAVKDSIIRNDSGTNRGSGKDPHNTAGLIGADEDQTLIDFENIPAGITGLTYARLYMHRSTGSPPTGHDTPDNGAQLVPSRITGDWSEGGAGADHLYSSANAVKWPGPASTGALSARGSQPASGWWFIEVGPIVQSWIDGAAQKGIKLDGATNADIVFDSLQGAASTKPYLELQWGGSGGGGANRAPNQPPTPTVTLGADGTSFTITATYSDPDGDTSTRYEVVYEPD
jgi:hypothetical protein